MSSSKHSWLHKILLVVSYLAVVCLTMQPRSGLIERILYVAAGGAVILLLIPARYLTLPSPKKPGVVPALLMLFFTLGLFFTFRANFLTAVRVKAYADRLGIPWRPLVLGLDALGCVFSLPIQWKFICMGRSWIRAAETARRTGEKKLGKLPAPLAEALLVLAVLALQFALLQGPDRLYTLRIRYYFVSLGLFAAVSLILALFLRRWGRAMLVSTILFAIWGIANHYVILFHGSPLYLSELASAGTAMNVLSEYRISFAELPWAEAAFAMAAFCLVKGLLALDGVVRGGFVKETLLRLALLAAALAFPAAVLLAPHAPAILGWSFNNSVYTFGFGSCVVRDAQNALFPYDRPEGYDPALLEVEDEKEETADVRPDIILILNETFFDLDDLNELDTDRDYMASFYGIEGASFGRAVVPNVGGGTNNSEFEFLTGNSMYLVNAPAPYNFIDFTERESNVAQYLKRLGYTSWAMHFVAGTNYSRSTAYPAMGFDHVLLGSTAEVSETYYGNRNHLDSVYYDMLKREYESYEGSEPRFFFVLTYQNHGGYERNDDALDTVHAGADIGGVRSAVLNEYLTSVSMSCDAFAELTEYFSQSDRPVVVCMVGDHGPYFLSSIVPDGNRGSAQESVMKRSVPYVIWSNTDLGLPRDGELMSLFRLTPTVLRAAGLPLSGFYETILSLGDTLPVLTSDGYTVDAEGRIRTYEYDDADFAPLLRYLCMEYAALDVGEDYREELYLPAA